MSGTPIPREPLLGLALPAPSSLARQVSTLIVHCSATPSGRVIGGRAPGQAGWRSPSAHIDEWHRVRGFRRPAGWVARHNPLLRHIGYHYVVDVDGRLWLGRHLAEAGAHAAGHNARSVGICLVGGMEPEGAYTPEQWATLAQLVELLCQHFGIAMQLPRDGTGGVCGHRDVGGLVAPDITGTSKPAPVLKSCPGFDVGRWLARGLVPQDNHVWPRAA